MSHRMWAEEVEAEFLRHAPNDAGWVHLRCPACTDRGHRDYRRKLAVSARTGWWRCFRADCGWRGRLRGFGDDEAPDPWDGVEAEEIAVEWEQPSSYVPLDDPEGTPGRHYVLGRGVGPDVYRAANVGYAPRGDHRGLVILPVLAVDGAMVGWTSRRIEDRPGALKAYTCKGLRRERTLYNAPAIVQPHPWVAVVEAPWSVLRLWPQAVATLGSVADVQVTLLGRSRPPLAIVLDGDMGTAGRRVAERVRRRGQPLCGAVILPSGAQPDTYADQDLLRRACARAADGVDVDLRAQ